MLINKNPKLLFNQESSSSELYFLKIKREIQNKKIKMTNHQIRMQQGKKSFRKNRILTTVLSLNVISSHYMQKTR